MKEVVRRLRCKELTTGCGLRSLMKVKVERQSSVGTSINCMYLSTDSRLGMSIVDRSTIKLGG